MKSLKITKQITRRETQSFVRYLQEISKMNRNNTLTPEQEADLAERIKKGDKKAENELIEKNLKFVISVAKQLQYEGCPIEDLVSEGNCGLIKAARKYDASRGCKFISYAVWWIRQSILCYLNENARTIRLPLNKIVQLKKIKKIQDAFEQEHQRKPSTEEIIESLEFEISTEDLDNMFLIDKGIQSLNVEITSNNSSKSDAFTLEDLLADYASKKTDEKLEEDDLKNLVGKILNKIPEKHKIVIELHYGLTGQEPKSLDEIANYLNLSKERIRQVKNSAIRCLGSKRNFNIVQPYLK